MRGYKPLIFILILVLTLSQIWNSPHKHKALVPGDLDNSLGKPGKGLLIWENDEDFQKICMENKATIRMGAFQTTLPDPLPGEEFNVGLAAAILAGTVVQPGHIFSLNQTIGPRTREKGFQEGPAYSGTQILRVIGGGICKISTTLYNVTILANQDVIERKAHGMLVPYVPPGQDATVSYGTADFKFRNTTTGAIVIWAEKVGNTLYLAFYGHARPPVVTWHHEILSHQEEPVIYRYNGNLPPGKERVVQKGDMGLAVKNWVSIRYPDGRSEVKELGVDYYKPMPKIIEINRPR